MSSTKQAESSSPPPSEETTPTHTAISVTDEGDESELVQPQELPPAATNTNTATGGSPGTTNPPTVLYPASSAPVSYYGTATAGGSTVVVDPFQTNNNNNNNNNQDGTTTSEPSPLSPPRGTATANSPSGSTTTAPGPASTTTTTNPALFSRLGGNTTPVVVYPSYALTTTTPTTNPDEEGTGAVSTSWMTADPRYVFRFDTADGYCIRVVHVGTRLHTEPSFSCSHSIFSIFTLHRNAQQQPSPPVNSQGMPITMGYVGGTMSATTTRSNRAYSFEESMLPPAATSMVGMGEATNGTGAGAGRLPPQELVNPAYSPYGGTAASTTSPGAASATLFPHPWPYSAAPPPDLYGTTPPSPLQPRPSPYHTNTTIPHLPHHPGTAAAVAMGYATHPHATLGMRPMPPQPSTTQQQQQSQAPPPPPPPLPGTPGGPYGNAGGGTTGGGGLPHHHHAHVLHHHHPQAGAGPFGGFHTSSPGPPIQTTASNKGPDGANLFIFHIPNHFSNLDMYQLFEPYGNLLSVRIMVERDTGRSRGFGFVSYDSPESAALAIKSLNGFAVRVCVGVGWFLNQQTRESIRCPCFRPSFLTSVCVCFNLLLLWNTDWEQAVESTAQANPPS